MGAQSPIRQTPCGARIRSCRESRSADPGLSTWSPDFSRLRSRAMSLRTTVARHRHARHIRTEPFRRHRVFLPADRLPIDEQHTGAVSCAFLRRTFRHAHDQARTRPRGRSAGVPFPPCPASGKAAWCSRPEGGQTWQGRKPLHRHRASLPPTAFSSSRANTRPTPEFLDAS